LILMPVFFRKVRRSVPNSITHVAYTCLARVSMRAFSASELERPFALSVYAVQL
jgi:hypothetical protein